MKFTTVLRPILKAMGVRFLQFLNSGSGRTGRTLGPTANLTYIQNGVELQFEVTPDVQQQYRNLRPRQWSGPEVAYKKQGQPLGTQWIVAHRSQGTGADDPMPQNVFTASNLIAYYDAPGPNLTPYIGKGISWLHVVQNFTGWIEGTSATGATERLCEAAAWFSIVSVVDENWQSTGGPPRWQRVGLNRSGTGWSDVSTPPNM